MPYAQAEGARLYYEETGSGYPIIFVHEFGSDYREWETQVRWFSRSHRCITYSARGYKPSEVPEADSAYGWEHAVADVAAVLRHLGIAKAHVAGLSMGGYATLLFGLRHPQMASALVVAGCGSGSPPSEHEAFRRDCEARAQIFLKQGSAAVAQDMGHSPTRIQLKDKDPRGWEEFMRHFTEHDAKGSGLTMRNYQGRRPSLTQFTAELAKLTIPTLLVIGDEDDPCVETNIFLKRTIESAALLVVPRTGHAVNLEEPAAFNAALDQFFATVERGKWRMRNRGGLQ